MKIGIVIGRFSPPHLGHIKMIKHALSESDRVVIIIGSARRASTPKNPWSDHDRVAMISGCLIQEEKNIHYIAVSDHLSDNAWLTEVRVKLTAFIHDEDDVTLYGHDKDHSTYYLGLFPDWKFKEVGQQSGGISATTVRKELFEEGIVHADLPVGTFKYLNQWIKTDAYQNIKNEYDYIANYKKEWKPTIFITVDAVIIYCGKIYVIKRDEFPGKGLFALPGGFVHENEKLDEAVYRVIKRETKLKIHRSWFKTKQLFDDPDRSLRGRIITNAYRFEIPRSEKIDLSENWIDLASVSLYSERFFEDHYFIIEEMTK